MYRIYLNIDFTFISFAPIVYARLICKNEVDGDGFEIICTDIESDAFSELKYRPNLKTSHFYRKHSFVSASVFEKFSNNFLGE